MIIVEVGSINMDLVVRLPCIPKPGETIMATDFTTYAGGKGANQAVAAARMGAAVHMVGCVGKDAFGIELRQHLIEEGIKTDHVIERADQATGVALIQVDEKGQNSIAVAGGANLSLTEEDVVGALNEIGDFATLVMPLETPLRAVFAAARVAKEKGARVILNPAPAQKLDEQLLKMVDVLVPNEHEIQLITGIDCRNDRGLRNAAAKLFSLGLETLVVTLGGGGAAILSREGKDVIHVPAFSVDPVDTTAAGDCFVGTLAVALSEGLWIDSAVQMANAAAALSVTQKGAQPSLPYRTELTRFLHEQKID
jgi:ribokinase